MQSEITSRLISIKNKYSNKYAIVSDDEKITYSELFQNAYRYKTYLQTKMKGKKIVCVVCNRSIKLYSIVLGIILAGGSYLLYELSDINDNTLSKIKSIHPDVVLVENKSMNIDNSVNIEDISLPIVTHAEAVIREISDYIYFVNTSGTMGNGKIVAVKDENIICYLNAYIKQFGVSDKDILFQQSPIFYDGFAEEFFVSLMVGGTLVYTKTQNLKNPQKIIEQVNKHNVTILPSTPLLIGEMNRLKTPIYVRKIVSSGDILRYDQIDWLIEHVELYNMYGLTETTVCATYHLCSNNDKDDIAIGKALDGYEIVLLDDKGREVENGEQGEIYIGGKGVIDGYYNKTDLEETIINGTKRRMFQTGDFAWKDSLGEYHYVGRKDRTLKIRANRVNLDEIEEILRGENKILDIVITYSKIKELLLCFFVSNSLTVEDVRRICKSKLLPYMLPNQIMKIEKIPMSLTGKVNYAKLEEKYNEILVDCEKGNDEITEQIIQSVLEISGCKSINMKQTWEEIGIDSFSYIKLLVLIEEKYKIELGDDLLMLDGYAKLGDFCNMVKATLNQKNN